MDLHEFTGGNMYFNENISSEVLELLAIASDAYAEGGAEQPLIMAYGRAPESLTVLVGLYRFYYYQRRYQNALEVADRMMGLASKKLNFPESWEYLDMTVLGYGVMQSMTLVRFYLLSLKGAGYLNLRLGNIDVGTTMLEKVVELDTEDRLGALALLNVVESYQRRASSNFGKLALVYQ